MINFTNPGGFGYPFMKKQVTMGKQNVLKFDLRVVFSVELPKS